MVTLYEILTDEQTGLGIPVVYSHFMGTNPPKTPPYVAYIGNGQNTFDADNSHYWAQNRYQIEYYFTKKDEAQETAIETVLTENGFLYEKSGDVWIESEGVFVIYYDI